MYQYSSDSSAILRIPIIVDPSTDIEKVKTDAKEYYGERILKYCRIYNDDNFIYIEQCPAFLMMVLADMASSYQHKNTSGEDMMINYSKHGGMLGVGVNPHFNKAKSEFTHSAIDTVWLFNKLMIGGMVDGHKPATYYFITTIIST